EGGEHDGDAQVDVEEQVQAQRRAQELGQVGGHGPDLGDDPHGVDKLSGEVPAAELGQVPARGDAQLGGEALHEHGHQVGHQNGPEQVVTEPAAALDVGGEVARVDVGHTGDEGGTDEGQQGQQAATPALQG